MGRKAERMIDTIETEKVFKFEELMKDIKDDKDRKRVLEKLHTYFGHVSLESLYRLINASSVK